MPEVRLGKLLDGFAEEVLRNQEPIMSTDNQTRTQLRP